MALLEPRQVQRGALPLVMRGPARPAAREAVPGAPAPRRFQVAGGLSTACMVAVALLGIVVLAGWALGLPALTSVTPGRVSMKPNTALAFALGGLAALLITRHRGRAATAAGLVLAAVVAAIGMLTLLEYAAEADLGIDELLFREVANAQQTVAPGRMSMVAALALALAALALVLLAAARDGAAQLMAAAVLALALSIGLAELYGARLAQPETSTDVAYHTGPGLAALGLALLLARPRRALVGALLADEPGGLLARWLLGAALIALPVLGGLRRAGQDADLYGPRFGLALMVMASLVVLTAVVVLTAARVNALDRQRTAALARQAASERELRRTLDHLVRAQETERRRLATDVHDDALPALAAVGLQLELARAATADPQVGDRLLRAERELRAASARLRGLTFDLRPEALAREGLGAALRRRLERLRDVFGVDYELRDRVRGATSTGTDATLYRIALEALNNVAQHAQASCVQVAVERRDGGVELMIHDDGVGMGEADARPGHLGLATMGERAELVGGRFEIRSSPGAGTTIVAWAPLHAAPAARRGA